MPTPRPMSAASVGARTATLTRCENRSIAKVAVPSATTAAIKGSAMPTSEPKASRMMIAAASRPMASLLEGGVWLTCSMACPPTSTCSDFVSAPLTRSITRRTSALGSDCASLLKSTVA